MAVLQGLTEQEVLERRRRGEGNDVRPKTSRTYWMIVRTNLFSFFNNILFAIGVALIALGRINDAMTSVGLAMLNALISTVQEVNAKRKLDKISLINRPEVNVIREGQERTIEPAELVRGDLMRVRAGDQVVADGQVVGPGRLEMDEAALTGESDLVVKEAGASVYSGSYCVTGDALCLVEKVGMESFANQLTATARDFQIVKTPLQQEIAFVVRIIVLMVVVMSSIILIAALLEDLPFLRLVQIAAVLTGQVPYGLFFMIVVAYSIGATAIAREGALVQQVNAVESLSNIDVLCMDKTGTLTSNRIVFHALTPLCHTSHAAAAAQLAAFVHATSVQNRTSQAIVDGLEEQAMTAREAKPPTDEVPFASARKWSAVAFDHAAGDGHMALGSGGVYVLGAPEMLEPYLPSDCTAAGSPLQEQARAWMAQGLRVLLFAHNAHVTTLHDAAGAPALPALEPVALVALRDELRPQARETLEAFAQLGIRLKIISGDNPETVAALARQAGLPGDLRLISGAELAAMTREEFAAAAAAGTVFGRVTPAQKEQLVDVLTEQGHYVAMMGDGVNDVLGLKKAKLGIAMQSGSRATRNVADIVLLDDSFAALRPAFHEGRRIVSGMTSALFLFLARALTTSMVIVAISMMGLGFPFEPAHMALTIFSVGIPSLFLAWFARPRVSAEPLLHALARFVLPTAILTMLFGVFLYAGFYALVLDNFTTPTIPPHVVNRFEEFTGLDYVSRADFSVAAATILAQTVLSIFIAYTAFILILFLEPPHPIFTGWAGLSDDRRPAYLAAGLFVLFTVVVLIPPAGGYFGLFQPGGNMVLGILLALVLWFFALRTIWRRRLFEQLISVTE